MASLHSSGVVSVKSRQGGLTLVELMVVMVILAIISAVAFPIYSEQTRKARRTEGRTALLELAQAQERFFSVNGQYTDNLQALNLRALRQENATWETENRYYRITVALGAGNATYTATATAQNEQSDDVYCTQMSYQNTGVKNGASSGGNEMKCW